MVLVGVGYALSQNLTVSLTFAFAAERTHPSHRLAEAAGWVTVLLPNWSPILQIPRSDSSLPTGRAQSPRMGAVHAALMGVFDRVRV